MPTTTINTSTSLPKTVNSTAGVAFAFAIPAGITAISSGTWERVGTVSGFVDAGWNEVVKTTSTHTANYPIFTANGAVDNTVTASSGQLGDILNASGTTLSASLFDSTPPQGQDSVSAFRLTIVYTASTQTSGTLTLAGTLQAKESSSLNSAGTLQGKDTSSLLLAGDLQAKETGALDLEGTLRAQETGSLHEAGYLIIPVSGSLNTEGTLQAKEPGTLFLEADLQAKESSSLHLIGVLGQSEIEDPALYLEGTLQAKEFSSLLLQGDLKAQETGNLHTAGTLTGPGAGTLRLAASLFKVSVSFFLSSPQTAPFPIEQTDLEVHRRRGMRESKKFCALTRGIVTDTNTLQRSETRFLVSVESGATSYHTTQSDILRRLSRALFRLKQEI